MKIVVLEGAEANDFFDRLVNKVADNVIEKFEKRFNELPEQLKIVDKKWASTKEAKQILGVKSNKKMQSLRDQNLIKFSQHGRIIRYNTSSLHEFLENHIVR